MDNLFDNPYTFCILTNLSASSQPDIRTQIMHITTKKLSRGINR